MTRFVSQNGMKKITLSLPQDLLERFKAHVPARQRSALVAEILEDYLAIDEQVQALEESAGSWSDERYPELLTDEDIDSWLDGLRNNWQSTGK